MQNREHEKKLKEFGARIRSIRLVKKISQEELASLAQVHRTYIGMIERGEKNVTLRTMVNISNALEVDLADIVEGL